MITESEQRELIALNELQNRGKSSVAAKQSIQRLNQLETNFTNVKSADRYTQAIVFSTSAVYKVRTVSEAFSHLYDLAQIIEKNSPLAHTESELAKRKRYFEHGFEARNGYIIALRDLYRAFLLFSQILQDPDVYILTAAIRNKIETFVQENPDDHESLQFMIQEGSYAESRQARERYLKLYGGNDKAEQVILESEVFAKALKASTAESFTTAQRVLASVITMAVKDPVHIGTLAARSIAKNISTEVFERKTRKVRKIGKHIRQRPKVYDVSSLERLGELKV